MSTGLSAPVAQPNSLSSFLNDLNELAALKQQETQLATQLAASNPRDVLGTDTITFPNGLKRPATDAELMAAAKTFSDMPNAAMEGMSAATDILGNVPFMRDVVNTPVSMAAYVAARRIQNGPDDPLVKLTAPGMTKGRAFATIENARRQIESSEGGVQRFYESLGLPQPVANFVSGVHQQGVGNIEFLPVVLSSGLVAKGLAQGARKAGQKAVADLLEMEAKEAFQQGAGTLVKQQAAQMGAAAVNAAVNPLAAPKEIVQRITPRGLEQTPTGEFVPTGGESLGQAVPKAIVSQTIEMQTEGLGEIMGPALGAALKRSGLSAKAVAAVPEFVKRWASRAGVKTADDLARGMKSSIPGFHGVPQQLIEERINEVWQFAAGTQEDAGLTGKVVQGDLPGAAQQFGQEVAAFGIMGGVNRGLNKTGRQEAISDRVEPTALADWVRSNLQRAAFINEFPNSPSRQQWASIVETLPELAELDVRSSRDRTEFMQSFRQAYDIAAAQLEATAREQGRQLDDEWDAEERARGAQSLAAASQTPPTLVAQPPVPGGKNMGVKASVATPRDVTYEQGIVPPAWPEQVQQPQPQEQSDEAQQVQGQPQGRSEGQVAEPPQQQPQQPVAEQQPAVATQQMPPDIADAFEQAWSARDDFAMHSVLNNKAARQEFEKRTGVKVELQPGARAGSIARGFTAVSQQSVAEQQPPVSSQTPDLSDLEPDEQVKVRDRMSKGASLSKAKEDVKHMRASSVPWSMEVMDKLAGMGMPKAMQTEFVMKAQKGVQEWGTDWKQKRDALEAEYIAKIPQGQQPTFVNDVANEAQRAIMRLEDAGASDDVMKEFASRATQITATSKQDAKEKVAALEAEFTPQPDRPKIGQAGVTKAVEEPPAQSSPPKKVGLRGQTAIPGTEESVADSERKQEARKAAESQFTSKGGQQQSFITGIGRDLPGQNTLFDVDPLPGVMGKDSAAQRDSESTGTTGTANLTGYELQQVPVSDVKIDPRRFQFKGNVNEEGVVTENALQGDYDPMAGGVFTLWKDKSGQLYVVNGHHRFDLARKRGVQTIPAFVLDEADGITESKARAIGAEVNIKEGQGTEHDYAQFFRETDISEEAARERGLLARRKGQAGFVVGKFAIDDLYYGFRNGKVGLETSFDIADIARDRKDVQAVALRRAKTADNPKGLSGEDLRQFLYIAVNTKPATSATMKKSSGGGGFGFGQKNLFGEDESFLREMELMGKAANSIIQDKKQYLLAGGGFLRRPEAAGELGISADEQRLADEYQQRREDFERWDKGKWQTDPELHAQVRRAAGLEEGDKGATDTAQRGPKEPLTKPEKNKGVKKPRKPKGGGGSQVLGLTVTPRSTRAMAAEVTESEKKDKKEPKTPIGAFQRLESPETRPTTPTPRPVDIVESMRKLFGDPIDIGRLRMRGSLGEFDVRTEAIALRKGYEGAILVAGHETAHRVDKKQNVVAGSVPNEVRRALVKVDYAPTTHAIAIANGADKYLSQREGFAEYVRHRLQGTTRGPALQKLVADGEVTDAYAEALGVIDNWFETEWLPQHPDIAKRLATLVDATQQYIQAGPQGRIEAGTRNERGITAAQVSRREYPDVALSQVGDAVTRFRRDWVNRWEFLDAYEKDIVRRGGKLPENNMSSYQFARSLSNVPSLTASFVEDGVRSWDGKTLYHPGLVAAIRDSGLNDEEVREWEAYHIARRVMAIHKEKPEYRSSADIRDMEAMVQQITDDPSKAERYEKMTKAYSAFNNAVLDWAVDMKLVDSAAAEKMKKSYDGVYMYMSREQTKRGKPSSISPGAGIGILPLHNPFRRLKQGSQMPFYRPIEAALLKTSETISNAFQHQIVRQMWNAQRKVEGMGAWITPVANANKATRFKLDDVLAQLVDAKVISKEDADTIRAVDNVKRGELTDKTLKTIADALGVDAEQFEDDVEGYQSAVAKAAEEAGIADAAAVMTIWKPSFELSRKEGVFSFKDDNGQMVTVRVHPEILNTLLMSRGLGTLNAVGKLIATLGGMISRGAVKYNLAFPLPNLDRDYLTSQAQSNEQGIGESLVRPFATASSMLVDALKSHGIVAGERDIMNELFHKKGAAEWYALDTSPVGLHDLRRHVLTSAGVTQPFVLQDSLRGGLKKITDILTVGEALIRQGEFVAALHNAGYYVVNNRWHTLDEAGNFVPMKEGQQPPEYVIAKAALAARDVTVDFQTVGALVARMPKVFGPFFAAKVQSLDRMYQQIKRALAHPDKAVRDKAMKRLLAYAAMQSALAALIWYFTHDKDWYKAGRESYAIYRNFMPTSTMRIPKGYEWSIFANITEAALNVAFDKEPENTKKAVERFLNEKSVLGELAYATAESMSPVSLPPKVPIVEDMPLVSTMYQLGVNRDWRGKPIVSKDLEGLESAEQYRDTTPGVYRAIGKATGTSPVKIEYATDSLSGGMTRQVTRAGTKLMEGDVGGAATQAVLGGFMLPRDSSRATNDYFEALAKADKRVQTAERRGKPDPEAKDALDMLNAYSDVLKAIRKTAREAATEDEKTALWHMEIGTARDAIGKQPLARYKSAMSPDAHLPPKIKEARDEELLKQMRKIAANKPVSVTERERKQGLTLAEKQAEWARDKKVAAQILKGAGWSWSKLAPVWTAGTDRTDTEGTKRARIRVAVDLGSQ